MRISSDLHPNTECSYSWLFRKSFENGLHKIYSYMKKSMEGELFSLVVKFGQIYDTDQEVTTLATRVSMQRSCIKYSFSYHKWGGHWVYGEAFNEREMDISWILEHMMGS